MEKSGKDSLTNIIKIIEITKENKAQTPTPQPSSLRLVTTIPKA